MPDKALEEQFDQALLSHENWKKRLKRAIAEGRIDRPVEDIRACDCCEFGRWIEGEDISPMLKIGKPYQVTRRVHREFHEAAAEVARHALEGRAEEAEALMQGAYAESSEKLKRVLTLWRSELQ